MARFLTIVGVVIAFSVACQDDAQVPPWATYPPPTTVQRYQPPTVPSPTEIPLHPCVKIAIGYHWLATSNIPDGVFKRKLRETANRVIEENDVELANQLLYSVAATEETYHGYSAVYDPDSWFLPPDEQTPTQRWFTRWVSAGCAS